MTSLDGIEQHLPAESRTLTVLIHGFEGSRADWRERGGYSKGGDLTDRLRERGMAWVACDLYGHGDWPAEEDGFSTGNISDELFPSFVARSADAVRQAIEVAVVSTAAERVNVVSYSAGCHVAVVLLGLPLPRPATTVLLAAPTPERAYDDEYSLHNNLEVFEGLTAGLFCGREDDEAPYADVVWLSERFPPGIVRRWDYDAGHALPTTWVDDAIAVLAEPPR